MLVLRLHSKLLVDRAKLQGMPDQMVRQPPDLHNMQNYYLAPEARLGWAAMSNHMITIIISMHTTLPGEK